MKTSFRTTAFFIVIALILFGCSSEEEIFEVDPKFRKWVSGYTSDVVSKKDIIYVELKEELDSAHIQELGSVGSMDDNILDEAFQISPNVEGTLEWVNERTISFIPKHDLKSNQLYTVSFDLKRFTEVDNGYEEFRFQFATMPQKITVEDLQLGQYDSYNLEWYYLSGNLTTTDVADTSELKKVITAEYNGKELPVKLERADYDNMYNITIDSILRKEDAGTVVVKWDGEPIQSFSSGKSTIAIPSLHDFDLTDATVQDDGDQSVSLVFSEPMDPSQNLKGIIDLEGVEGETFSIAYNEITVFLPHRIEGEFNLKVHSGIRNIKGYTINYSKTQRLSFDAPKPRLRMIGEGSILPDSKGLIFPFESVGLKSVTVRVVKVYEDNVHHFLQVNNLNGSDALFRFGKKLVERKIKLNVDAKNKNIWTTNVLDLEKWIRPEPGAIYRIGIKFSKEDAMCDCEVNPDDSNNEDEEVIDEDWSESAWHRDDWEDGYSDWGGYDSDESPCDDDYYNGKAISRNILASNIGIIYKQDGLKNGHVFVTDMITTQPMANTTITFYDYAKQSIATGKTNDVGMFTTPLSRKPFLLVAKHGKQRGYLKVSDGHSNTLSEFDVDGEEVQDGLKGYIYGERGVWRPGDSIYLNFVLNDLEKKLPSNHPVNFILSGPNGEEVSHAVKTKGLNGHYDFRTATGSDAPTGIYTATITVGSREFVKYLKIETVKPNRLKMKLSIPEGDSLTKLTAAWLHGAPAKNLEAMVTVELRRSKTIFPDFKNYVFDSPLRDVNTGTISLFDGKLNAEGISVFNTHINSGNLAPGMLKATYTTRVFEKGGDFSIDRFSMPYSPYKNYVGLSIPKMQADESILSGVQHRFPVVVTNSEGKLSSSTTKLRVKIYRMEWRWWFEESDEDMSTFIGKNGNLIVYDTILTTATGKTSFDYGIPKGEYGRFLITVTDEFGQHQTGTMVSMNTPYWERGNQQNNEYAAMLNFATDKTTYIKGETVKVSLPTAAAGKALISLETRKKIIQKFWINTQKGETTFSFPTTEEMSPNVYVHITLIQPHSATTNDLPIRMYGIAAIHVDDPATHLHPIIKVPKEWRPESTASISVREESGKEMTYTLAIVDEGLLDLTRFQTPNPWNTFHAKEALGVKTWDMYDDVIGAYGGKLDRLLSIGGDGSADDGAGQKANRFKPMVHFLGPFVLPAGSSKTHTIQLPTYIGSVRVMVVAHNDKASGFGEETIAIKKPLMVLGTLPRVISTSETIQLPVDVFAMENSIKKVQLEITTNELLTINGKGKQELTFTEIGDQLATFELHVKERIGIARIKITARSGNESATQEFEVDVRNPNPPVCETTVKTINPGESVELPALLDGIGGSHNATVELSTLPPFNLSNRMDELINYPHGCIEQTTSAVFPQLMAMDLMKCSSDETKEMTANIKAALHRYQSFQTSNGGFAYWPGGSESNEWGSNYAGHFLIEAELHGFSIPVGLKTKWLEYQKDKANNWNSGSSIPSDHGDESNQLIQAYRLYTLALANKPELGAMNRMKEMGKLGNTVKWRLAAAYYIMGQREVARTMTKNTPLSEKTYRELAYSYGSDFRDKAMILEAALMIHPGKTTALEKEITGSLNSSDWLSTQETGYALIALSSGRNKKSGSLKAKINDVIIESTKTMHAVHFSETELFKSKRLRIRNTSSKKLYLTYHFRKIPKKGKEKTEASKLRLTTRYLDMSGNVISPDQLVQGTDFKVEITVYNPTSNQLYKEMSLNQIFPSGWEIHNARLYDESSSNAVDYQDIRDDRVYSYFKLAPKESKQIVIQLNASYLGKFYLPAVYCEAMYDQSIHAQQKGKWIQVVKENVKPKPKSTKKKSTHHSV